MTSPNGTAGRQPGGEGQTYTNLGDFLSAVMAAQAAGAGVLCALMRHDAWCPGKDNGGRGCICNPTYELVSESKWREVSTQSMNRAQRRAAARRQRRGGQ